MLSNRLMVDRYLDSNGGAASSPYANWTDAADDMDQIIAIPILAGDIVYMAADHAESGEADISWTFTGTPEDPNLVISALGGSASPVTYDEHDNIQASTAGNFTLRGGVKFYGASFRGKRYDLRDADDPMEFTDCLLESTDASDTLIFGIDGGHLRFVNTDVNFSHSTGNAALGLRPTGSSLFEWWGGVLTYAGSTQPTALFNGASGGVCSIDIRGVTLTDITTAFFDISDLGEWNASVANCLIADGVAATVGTGESTDSKVLLSNSDDASSDSLYRMDYNTFYGSVVHETVFVVSSGGASDGTTPISWKMTNNGNTEEFFEPLVTRRIPLWIDSTVSQKFVVQCIWAAGTPTDHEVWMELEYYASGDTISTFTNNGATDPLDTADTISTATGVSWDGSLASGDAFSLEITVTPGRKGPAFVRIYFAQPTGDSPDILYVDPLVTVTAT